MPELCRFFGIIIRMYWEANAPHHNPHFHAYYHDDVAVLTIDPVELIAVHYHGDNRDLLRHGLSYINKNC